MKLETVGPSSASGGGARECLAFAVGDAVEGNFYGDWYPGVITELVSQDQVEVYWDGEHSRSHLNLSDVRRQDEPERSDFIPLRETGDAGQTMSRQSDISEQVGFMRRVRTADGHERAGPSAAKISAFARAGPVGVADNTQAETTQLVGCAVRRYRRDVEQAVSIIRQVYVENNGAAIVNCQFTRKLQSEDAVVAVSSIRFSHNRISSVFCNGRHAGQRLTQLVEDLVRGRLLSEDLLDSP